VIVFPHIYMSRHLPMVIEGFQGKTI